MDYLLPSQIDEVTDTLYDVGLDYKVEYPSYQGGVGEAKLIHVLGLDSDIAIALANRNSYMIVEDRYDVLYDGLGIDALRGVLVRFADGEL